MIRFNLRTSCVLRLAERLGGVQATLHCDIVCFILCRKQIPISVSTRNYHEIESSTVDSRAFPERISNADRLFALAYHSRAAAPFGALFGMRNLATWSPAQALGRTRADRGRNVAFWKVRVAWQLMLRALSSLKGRQPVF
jgi:hypothetical protein